MLLDYVPFDAVLRPQISSLITFWFQIRFLNCLDEQWANTDMFAPPQFKKLCLQMNLKEAWEPTFTAG